MYLPKLNESKDFNIFKNIIKENSFASLTLFNQRIYSTKALMLFEGTEDNFHLETHLNRANPVARNLESNSEVLCDFLGVHAYISSSWYNHTNVSTWNYEQVQIYGKVTLMKDEELYNHLYRLTNIYELPQQCPMTLDKMGKDFVENEMRGAVGYKIIPTEVKIKQKFSQNRDQENLRRIIDVLSVSEKEADKKMAEKMLTLLKIN